MVRFGLADTTATNANAVANASAAGTRDESMQYDGDASVMSDDRLRMPGAFVSSPMLLRQQHRHGRSDSQLGGGGRGVGSPAIARHKLQQQQQQHSANDTPNRAEKRQPQITQVQTQTEEASMADETMEDSILDHRRPRRDVVEKRQDESRGDASVNMDDSAVDVQDGDESLLDAADNDDSEAYERGVEDDEVTDEGDEEEDRYELAEDWPTQLQDTSTRYRLLARSTASSNNAAAGYKNRYDMADLQDDLFGGGGGKRKRNRQQGLPPDASRAKFAFRWANNDRLLLAGGDDDDEHGVIRSTVLHDGKRAPSKLLRALRDDLINSTREVTAASLGETSVWKLASALFDPIQGAKGEVRLRNARRGKVLEWLKWRVGEDVRKDEKRALDASERIFAKLTGNQVVEACGLALSTGDLRLATLLAQAGGDDAFRESLAEQVEDWRKRDTLSLVKTSYRMIYELLAGNTVVSVGTGRREDDIAGTDLPLCRGLDWQRAFGLKLWYGIPLSGNLDDAFDLYDEAVAGGTAAPPMRGKVLDMEYLLLRHACTTKRGLESLLDPASLGDAWSDYTQTWMLAVFLATRSTTTSSLTAVDLQSLDRVSSAYATQLAQDNAWLDALTVASCLSSTCARETLSKRILARCTAAESLSDNLRTQLASLRTLPEVWVLEAQALHYRSKTDHESSCAALLDAGLVNEAHRTIRQFIGPQAVITGRIDALASLLSRFTKETKKVVGWETCGQVYQDVVKLIQASRPHTTHQHHQHSAGGGGGRQLSGGGEGGLDLALVQRIWQALDGVEVVSFEQRVAKSELVALVASCLPPMTLIADGPFGGSGGLGGRGGGAGGATTVRDVDLAAGKARQLSVI